ncbi:MAG TPA: ABC transporter permease [Thermoanaerobaculia bacterium]|jgi:ABC-type multidrug transport system permease subunit|nr:ABC transporter permease [Thermoanaerobaculia bacterium]
MSERSYSPLWELTAARAKEFLREPEALFWVFFFPVILAAALGFAFREKGPDRIPVGVVAASEADPAAAGALAALGKSPALLPRRFSAAEGRDALRTGRISLLVEPGPPMVFHFDETRPDSRIARLEADDALQRASGRKDVLPVRAEKITERGSRYIDFLIPGLLGMNLMGSGIWSLGFSVTTARNRRILKRLIATPMPKGFYLLSQILGRLGFLLPEVAILVGGGWLFFGVGVRGSLLLLFATCLLGAMTFCGLGLLIASRVNTIEGVSGLANLVMLPMWILSGVFFSSERFPDAVQPFINALPLTALNQALRGIMTEGRGLAGIATQLVVLTLWGLASFAVALKIFRWR